MFVRSSIVATLPMIRQTLWFVSLTNWLTGLKRRDNTFVCSCCVSRCERRSAICRTSRRHRRTNGNRRVFVLKCCNIVCVNRLPFIATNVDTWANDRYCLYPIVTIFFYRTISRKLFRDTTHKRTNTTHSCTQMPQSLSEFKLAAPTRSRACTMPTFNIAAVIIIIVVDSWIAWIANWFWVFFFFFLLFVVGQYRCLDACCRSAREIVDHEGSFFQSNFRQSCFNNVPTFFFFFFFWRRYYHSVCWRVRSTTTCAISIRSHRCCRRPTTSQTVPGTHKRV